MKSPSSLLALVLFGTVALASERRSVQSLLLDDRAVVSVPVGTNRVTTISFPGPISAIDAAGISTDPKMPGLFQLAHAKGSSFLSVRAVARKAATNLNVRWKNRTYVFELFESEAPILSLNLESPSSRQANPAPEVDPTQLLSLLDKAKMFPLLKQQHPESVAQVDFTTYDGKPLVSDFNDHEIRIEEAYRFNPEDTLVFRVAITNKTDRAFLYRPNSFTIRTGNRLYPQSLSDAAGRVAPLGGDTAYFAVTGAPDGGRNELSLKNEFTVFVSRVPEMPSPMNETNLSSVVLPPVSNETP